MDQGHHGPCVLLLKRIHHLHRENSLSCIDDIDDCQQLSSATLDYIERKALTSGFQTCPTHEESINISFLGQLFAVLLAHTAAINNPRGFSCVFRNGIGKPFAYRGMDFLCLLRRGDFTSADGPNGFIGDDDFGPVFGLLCDGLELGGHHFDGLIAFSLLPISSACEVFPQIGLCLLTSSVSPQHSMTPKPPSSAAFVLLATNYIPTRSSQHRSFFSLFDSSSSCNVSIFSIQSPLLFSLS